MPDIAHHTDDAPIAAGAHDLADRILSGPERTRQGLVDDDHGFGGGYVSFGDIAPVDQRDAQGFQVAIADDAHKRDRELSARVHLPFGRRAPTAIPPEREGVGETGGDDARDVTNAAQHVVEVGILLGLGQIAGLGVHADGGGLFGPEAEVDIEHAQETAHQQARADQQHAGEGDLGNHQARRESSCGPCPPWTRARCPSARRAGRWRGLARTGARPKTTPVRTAASRQKARTVTSAWTSLSSGMLSASRCARMYVPPVARSTPSTAPQVESATPSVSIWRMRRPPPRAQRRTDGNLLVAGGGAGEQQVGEIRAHDQHDHAHRECQHQQRRPYASADVFGQRGELAFEIVAFGMGAGNLPGEGDHFGLGAADRNSGLQTADDRHGVSPAVGLIAEGKRKVEIEVAAGGEDGGEIE